MRLGFDLDEVVVNLTKEIENHLAVNYGIDWPAECFITYGFDTCHYTSDEELNKTVIKDLIVTANDAEFQFTAKPIEGVVEVLQKFKKSGHKIYFITARPKQNQPLTYKWLRKYKIPFDGLKFVGQDEEKGVCGMRLKLDMFVDDLYNNLESMWRYKKKWRKGLLLFDRPWNSKPIDTFNYTRVKDWKTILRHVGINNR